MTGLAAGPSVVVTVPGGTDLSVSHLAQFSIAWAGARTHQMVVCVGARRLELPESWSIEPSPGMMAALGKLGLEAEVFDA